MDSDHLPIELYLGGWRTDISETIDSLMQHSLHTKATNISPHAVNALPFILSLYVARQLHNGSLLI